MSWLLGVIVAAALTGAVWWIDDSAFDRGVQSERQRVAEEQADQLRESMRLGSQMAAAARDEARAARDHAATLQSELKRRDRPALVRAAACGVDPSAVEPGADGAAAGDAAGAASGPPGGPGLAALPAQLWPDAGRLTAAAVSLWDSALAGTVVPAGACRADDIAAGACAVATAITVDDAVDNHIVNAARCREDRIRHQRLIDYLKARERQTTEQEEAR